MQVHTAFHGAGESVADVAFGLVRQALSRRHPSVNQMCHHPVPAGRHSDGVVGPRPGCAEITLGQRHLDRVEGPLRHRQLWLSHTQAAPGGLACAVRRRDLAAGQRRLRRRHVLQSQEVLAEVRHGLQRHFRCCACRAHVAPLRLRNAQAHEA